MSSLVGKKVEVFKWEQPEGSKFNAPFGKVEDGFGTFLGFGVSYEELGLGLGVGSYSAALIIRPDGFIENLSFDLIRFIGDYE